ncbi:hypothetical protein JAAARDRAFT_138508, partial [Jaapia argillacea MUCL 33604]
GSVNFSLGWHQRGREKPGDPLLPSAHMRDGDVQGIFSNLHRSTTLVNTIYAVTQPGHYEGAKMAMAHVRKHIKLNHPEYISASESWSSVFTGLTLVSNCVIVPHLDKKGLTSGYDLLVSAGTHRKAVLKVQNLGPKIAYGPSTMVELCGRFLIHEVEDWEGGERLCFAHYLRDSVFEVAGIADPGFLQ